MCLLLFAVNEHPDYPLVVAANRDEFRARPTEAARFWDEAPEVLAGRDLERGGTWLGVSRDGRWAAVTSFREAQAESFDTSRGHLVSNYLEQPQSPRAYAGSVVEAGRRYAGFNLLVGDASRAVYCSNRHRDIREIDQGIHGLSNHLLNTPWPKVVMTRERFAEIVHGATGPEVDLAFEVLGSPEIPPDEDLPETGVGLELERLLSSAFIAVPDYGTRCSTVLLVDAGGEVTFIERTYLPGEDGAYRPRLFRDTTHRFQIDGPRPAAQTPA